MRKRKNQRFMGANVRKIEFMWSKMRSVGLGLFRIVAYWSALLPREEINTTVEVIS